MLTVLAKAEEVGGKEIDCRVETGPDPFIFGLSPTDGPGRHLHTIDISVKIEYESVIVQLMPSCTRTYMPGFVIVHYLVRSAEQTELSIPLPDEVTWIGQRCLQGGPFRFAPLVSAVPPVLVLAASLVFDLAEFAAHANFPDFVGSVGSAGHGGCVRQVSGSYLVVDDNILRRRPNAFR